MQKMKMVELISVEDKNDLKMNEGMLPNLSNKLEFAPIPNKIPGDFYKPGCCECLIGCLCPCCKTVDLIHMRQVYFNHSGHSKNLTRFPNQMKNQKYNILTIIPIVLFNQFRLFSNQFYFLMAISQFFEELKVGLLFSYVAPFVFVLVITFAREAYDDHQRYLRDHEANNQKYFKITKKGKKEILSSHLQVGDIVELNQNQRIPADMLLLKTYEEDQCPGIYIRTDQLDGETDWKLRKPAVNTQKYESIQEIFDIDICLVIDPPSRSIYEFNGVLLVNSDKDKEESSRSQVSEPLGLENTLWSNSVLASKKAIGCVIYTGKDTRSQLNSSLPRSKIGILDLEINKLTKILFAMMVLFSIFISILKGLTSNILQDLINFMRYIVLLCSIIPISLRTNLDIAKTINSHNIASNPLISGAIPRNSTIPEELGRIEYVITDKTGTLTKNEMKFKKLSMEVGHFDEDNINDIKLILQDECAQNNFPMSDLISLANKGEYIYNGPKRLRRNRSKIIRDSITAMALCNNVTPIHEEGDGDSKLEYQASSPDEVALVIYAESLNMTLINRTDRLIKMKNSAGYVEEYEVLAYFPFTSDTKRMGTVVRNLQSNKKIFYLKGAENVIENFVKEDYKSYIKEHSEMLASSGLRTLVITQRLLDDEFYNNWSATYHNAQTSMENRKEKLAQAISLLERNMEFLCVTGVEDQLQDNVAETIESLRNAGMKLWMLTGDKVETATCIAISTGLKTKQNRVFSFKDHHNFEILSEELDKLRFQCDFVIVIDGNSLDLALKNCEKVFCEIALKASTLVCCRCSPTQKTKIVRMIKKYANKRICAIGDGGNDVSMIQEAHVGIGIVGKEGRQASLAADYSINQFKDMNLLLLWFGRLSYKNTATISQFVIHRGLIISLMQFIFSIMFYCASIPLYNGMLILGYTSIYTALPVISLLYDRDTDVKNVMKFPTLYRALQKGRELSNKSFLWWFWKSLFQAGVIMGGSVLFFDKIFVNIVTVTFTCLIFAELLNVYTEIKKFHYVMAFSLVSTLAVYLLSLFFLTSVFDLNYLNYMTLAKIVGLTVISWIPFFLVKKIKKCIFPEMHEKLNSLKV